MNFISKVKSNWYVHKEVLGTSQVLPILDCFKIKPHSDISSASLDTMKLPVFVYIRNTMHEVFHVFMHIKIQKNLRKMQEIKMVKYF